MDNEDYCESCEEEGHRFTQCPRRDDEPESGGIPFNPGPLLDYLAVNRDSDPGADWL